MEWISVKEKLPEYQERILISAFKGYENGHEDYMVDIADRRFTNKDGHYWMNSNDSLRGWIVTHWQPLPKHATSTNYYSANQLVFDVKL